MQDFDDQKPGVQADSDVLTPDLFEQSKKMQISGLAHVEGKKGTISGDGIQKSDPFYDEFRFEVNYLF